MRPLVEFSELDVELFFDFFGLRREYGFARQDAFLGFLPLSALTASGAIVGSGVTWICGLNEI